jgi:hypothetical protein
MERYLERSATPARVRYAMRKHMKGYDICKTEGTWYVTGLDTACWYSSSLATATLSGTSVAHWIQTMMQMRDCHHTMLRMRDE